MQKGYTRAPIVTVLGHVDHGKTTLLDAIRKTSQAAREAGGITQSIGASCVVTKEGKKITFIDTPGHAAFSKMRSRGVNACDIAILVVAADDGVKPQTLEALNAIRESQTPFIVAFTKTDLPSASVETVQARLEAEGVLFEGRGGQTPGVPLSAKTGKGLDELLSLISLLSEVSEVKGDPKGPLEAIVIETSKDKRGILVSCIVRNGKLMVAQEVTVDHKVTKVRGLFDDKNLSIKEALPGEPVLILGFETPPQVGSLIKSKEEGTPVSHVQKTETKKAQIEEGQIPVFIKAKSAGSLEAILASVPKGVFVTEAAVGDVFESDVLSAHNQGTKYIFAFESKASPAVSKLAEGEGVKIERFAVIYELFERLEELVKKGEIEILGKAEILATFPFNSKKIAGCKITLGKITKSDKLLLVRAEKELGKVKIISMKKQKIEIAEAKAGEEIGILFEPQLDFAAGDVLVSVR